MIKDVGAGGHSTAWGETRECS